MPAKRRTLSEIESMEKEKSNVGDPDLPDVMDLEQSTPPAKQQKSSDSPRADSDAGSLPRSPSAFRFKYREPEKAISSSSPMQEATPAARVSPRSNSPSDPRKEYLQQIPLDMTVANMDVSEFLDQVVVNQNIDGMLGANTSYVNDPRTKDGYPPRLDNLPKDVLKNILRHVIPVEQMLTPWFNSGTSILGIRGFAYNDEGATFNPNIDISFLLVNRACFKAGSRILYGHNQFEFCYRLRSDCCKWWMERIGDHNLKKITRMTFAINTGWMADRRDPDVLPNPADMSHEETWYRALSHLHARNVKLKYMCVATLWWTDLRREPQYCEDDKEELWKFRKLVVDRLATFRGIRKVKIQQYGDRYIGSDDSRLALLMQQPTYTLFVGPPRPKMTIVQTIRYLKEQHEIAQQRVERQIHERLEAGFAAAVAANTAAATSGNRHH